jgi:hypothetical protein
MATTAGHRFRHFEFHIGTKNVKFVEDHPMYTHMDILALIIFVVSEKKAFEHFPIGFNVNLCLTLDPMGKMFQTASSLKPLGQLKPNCPGMIIGRSSIKFLFFMPIGNPRWLPPQDID